LIISNEINKKKEEDDSKNNSEKLNIKKIVINNKNLSVEGKRINNAEENLIQDSNRLEIKNRKIIPIRRSADSQTNS
jgi:hypothetical protein